MHGNEIIYALIYNKNHVLLCQYSMLSSAIKETIVTQNRDVVFYQNLVTLFGFYPCLLRHCPISLRSIPSYSPLILPPSLFSLPFCLFQSFTVKGYLEGYLDQWSDSGASLLPLLSGILLYYFIMMNSSSEDLLSVHVRHSLFHISYHPSFFHLFSSFLLRSPYSLPTLYLFSPSLSLSYILFSLFSIHFLSLFYPFSLSTFYTIYLPSKSYHIKHYQSPYLISPNFHSLFPSHNPHPHLSYLPKFTIHHYHSSIPLILLTLLTLLSIFKHHNNYLLYSLLFLHYITLYSH